MGIHEELVRAGCILEDGHFVYTKGNHGDKYFNKNAVYASTRLTRRVVGALLQPFKELQPIDTIAGPAPGATPLIVAATQMMNALEPAWITKKNGEGFVHIDSEFHDNVEGKRVLVFEDTVNSGGTVMQVVQTVRAYGGAVIGVSVICNRSGVTAQDLDVPVLNALMNVEFLSMLQEYCTLCDAGVPIVDDVGHGAEFKEVKPDYPGGYVSVLY